MSSTAARRLDFVTAGFAFIAAVFWFLSAYGNVPPLIAYWDYTPATDAFYRAVKFSARMNRDAAFFSGLSALSMTLRLVFSKRSSV
jgi:hypothetical protein